MVKHALGSYFQVGRIDAQKRVIFGVSLATEGPARGHGVMVDRTTLEQLLASAKQYQGGLKVKMSHKGDAGDIAGFLTNLRIEGKKLLGDLNLLENYSGRDYILEIASKIPDTFGLSVAFSGPTETVGGLECARCTEIYSCDLVADPAANADGLFSARGVDANREHIAMTPTPEEILTQCKSLIQSSLVEFGARIKAVEDSAKTFVPATELAAVKTQFTELTAKLDAAKTELAAKIGDSASHLELTAKTVAQEFARHTGQGPRVTPDNGNAEDPKPVDKFIETAVKHFSQTKSQSKALELAIAEDPKGYAAFRGANRQIKWAA